MTKDQLKLRILKVWDRGTIKQMVAELKAIIKEHEKEQKN